MSEDGDKAPGLVYNRRRRSRGSRPAGMKLEMPMVAEEHAEEEDDFPGLVYNRRRHSAVGRQDHDSIGLLPNFVHERTRGPERRHSLMVPSEALRRVSIDITNEQRKTLHLPRFSQVFGFSTFTGLPMTKYCDPVIGYENTYKMEPDKKFQQRAVKNVVEKDFVIPEFAASTSEVIDDLLDWDDDVLTDTGERPKGSKELAAYELAKHKRRAKLITKMVEEVKDEVKQLEFPRYKYVVNAMIGEIKGQGLRVASRCLWDTNCDRSVCIQRHGMNCFVTVLVHAIYFE